MIRPWTRALLLLALACRPRPDAPPQGWIDVTTPPPTGTAPGGAACLSADECLSGICEGQGCGDDQPGVCVDGPRACTRDLATYCGCDGQVFQTSGSCPNRRYAHRGACESITE
jgi:hypothetical protein